MIDRRTPKAIEARYRRIVDAGVGTRAHMAEYMPLLRSLASVCSHVTEFGTGGGDSTTALLAAQPEKIRTYDIKDVIVGAWDNGPIPPVELVENQGATDLRFQKADTRLLEIEETDLLFIDSCHEPEALSAELNQSARRVRRWIAMHDTMYVLIETVREFLRLNSEWAFDEPYCRTSLPGFTTIQRMRW